MPTIHLPAKVLVTGANGYLGMHIVKVLLNRGFSVRGTVRDDVKGQSLTKFFTNGSFEYVLVPEIEKTGAFDGAVKGVDAIIHTASPVKFEQGDPQLIIGPAVAGTTGILESAQKYEPNIKRIVITSSAGAVTYSVQGKYTFTEQDWNEPAVQKVKEQGASANPGTKYTASKTLAEQAAWKFIETNKANVNFDITTICPPMISGPALGDPDKATGANAYFLNGLKAQYTEEALIARQGSIVDVRDTAAIHVDLLTNEKAGNERFLASDRAFSWQDLFDAIHEEPAFPGIQVGVPGSSIGPNYGVKFDPSKLQAVLAVSHEETYRPMSETLKDFLKQADEKGWI